MDYWPNKWEPVERSVGPDALFFSSPCWRRWSSLKCLSSLSPLDCSDISPVWSDFAVLQRQKESLSLPWHIDGLDDSECHCRCSAVFAQCQVTHLTPNSSVLLKERESFTSHSVDAPDHLQQRAENFQYSLNPVGLDGLTVIRPVRFNAANQNNIPECLSLYIWQAADAPSVLSLQKGEQTQIFHYSPDFKEV